MRKVELASLGVLGLALILSGVPAAAQMTTGTVIGKVIDEDGRPAVGIEVQIKNVDNGRQATTKTDKNGEYFYSGLFPGKTEISIKYKNMSIKPREVSIQGGLYGDPNSGAFKNRGPQFDFNLKEMMAKGGQQSETAKKDQEEFDKRKVGFDRAVALNQAGKFEEALTDLQPVVEKDADQWVVQWQLAVAYAGLNRNDEAIAAYQKAVELNPPDPAILYSQMGDLYLKMKPPQVEEARKMFETAAQLRPEDAAQFYFNVAVTFYNTGHMKEAIEPLKKAIEANPDHAKAHFFLGVCLYNTAESKIEGGEVKAILAPGTRESFERYLALEPNGQYANDAKQYLQIIDVTIPAAVRVKKK